LTIKVIANAVVISWLHSFTHARRSVPWPQHVSADCCTHLRRSQFTLSSQSSKPVS